MVIELRKQRRAICVWAGLFAFVLGSCALATPIHAQSGTPNVDIRRLERRFDVQDTEQSRQIARRWVPQISRAAPAADTRPMFVLHRVSLAGNHAIPRDRVSDAWTPYIGKKVSQADLAAIATSVGDVYRKAGFHLSRAIVPPQDIANGAVRIQVIEGSVADVALKGDGAEKFGLRAVMNPVVAEQPSRLQTLERQLMLVSIRPGVRITDTQLEEIGAASGRFRLIVHVETWHLYSYLSVDNMGAPAVGPWQSYATAAYNSLITGGDTLALNLSTTPGDHRELRFARLSYDMPIGVDGVRIGASGLYSEVRPGDWRREFADKTRTESFEVRASITPIQSQQSSLTLTLAFGFLEARERDVLGPLYKDSIRTISLNSDYRWQDSFSGTNYLTVNWRQGIDFLGASDAGDPFISVLDASPRFSALNFWFSRYQTLSDAFSVKLASAGQVASGPMHLSQQFFLGGLAFGRGYGAAELSGDNGIAGSFELRFDQKLSYEYWTGFQLYSFVDTGLAWWDGLRPADGAALTSVGGGVRFFLGKDLQADFGITFPLGYRAPDNQERHPRFLFTLSNAFRLCHERAATRCS